MDITNALSLPLSPNAKLVHIVRLHLAEIGQSEDIQALVYLTGIDTFTMKGVLRSLERIPASGDSPKKFNAKLSPTLKRTEWTLLNVLRHFRSRCKSNKLSENPKSQDLVRVRALYRRANDYLKLVQLIEDYFVSKDYLKSTSGGVEHFYYWALPLIDTNA